MTATPDLTLLVRDAQTPATVKGSPSIRILRSPKRDTAAKGHNLFVMVCASELGEVADFVTTANKRNQLRALFVRCDVDPELLPQMFELAKVRTMRNTIVHSDFEVPTRILRAWRMGTQHSFIACAHASDEDLFVLSCEPHLYRIPFASVPALKGMSPEERARFTLAEHGNHLHWDAQDVDLDLDSLLVTIDPARKAAAERIKKAYGQRYGTAIERVRLDRGLRQTDIPGLSEREVRRIEAEGEASLDSLRKLADAHKMDLKTYLDRVANLIRREPHSRAPRGVPKKK